MSSTDYYNTNHESGTRLATRIRRNMAQDKAILEWARQQEYGRLFTPFDVQRELMPSTPITSIRRALHTLTKKNFLEKTESMVIEQHDSKNHQWRLKQQRIIEDNGQMRMFA
jgi:hypothetical protein